MKTKAIIVIMAILLVLTLTSCGEKKKPGATAPGQPQIKMIEQSIVPSYGNYEGGILYHYYDANTNRDIYIFNGTNKAGVGVW